MPKGTLNSAPKQAGMKALHRFPPGRGCVRDQPQQLGLRGLLRVALAHTPALRGGKPRASILGGLLIAADEPQHLPNRGVGLAEGRVRAFGLVPVLLPVLLVVSAEMQPAPHNFTVFPVAADLSAANMTRWLAAASARLVRAMSLPESSASKKAWNWV